MFPNRIRHYPFTGRTKRVRHSPYPLPRKAERDFLICELIKSGTQCYGSLWTENITSRSTIDLFNNYSELDYLPPTPADLENLTTGVEISIYLLIQQPNEFQT